MYVPKISFIVFSLPSLFASLKKHSATSTIFIPKALEIDVYDLYNTYTKH